MLDEYSNNITKSLKETSIVKENKAFMNDDSTVDKADDAVVLRSASTPWKHVILTR